MEKWTRLLIYTATFLLLLTLVGVVIHLGIYINHTLLLFSLGALIAYALDPLVEFLRRRHVTKSGKILPRELCVGIVFLGLFVVIGFSVWSLSGHLIRQATTVETEFSETQRQIAALPAPPEAPTSTFQFLTVTDRRLAARNIHFSLISEIQHPPPDLKQQASNLGTEALPALRHVFTDLGESVIVLLIALYFLIFATEMRQKFNGLLPERLRERADLLETDVNRILGGFVRGQLIIALIMGAAAAIGCLLLGIHLWLIIGLIVVAASLIPVFGPYLGAVPAVIAALIGPTHLHSNVAAAVIIAVYFVVINEVGSKILYPKLVGAALGLHTVLVLFVLFAGLEIGGIVGVLFAAPVTALVIVSLVHLYRFWQDLPDSLLANVARRYGKVAERQPIA